MRPPVSCSLGMMLTGMPLRIVVMILSLDI
jgi:hypothetical protein